MAYSEANFSMDYEAVESQIATLSAALQTYTDALTTFKNNTSMIAEGWVGQGADSFKKAIAEAESTVAQLNTIIATGNAKVLEAKAKYAEMDMQVSGSSEAIVSDNKKNAQGAASMWANN